MQRRPSLIDQLNAIEKPKNRPDISNKPKLSIGLPDDIEKSEINELKLGPLESLV